MPGHPEQAQRALLLEVERPRAPQPAGAFAKVSDGGPDRRLGQYTKAERERRRTDVKAPLKRERGPYRVQVAVGEPAVPPVARLHRREQAQGLPVPQHPR